MNYQTFAVYFDDSWKASRRITVEFGIRMDHDGHWYDHQQNGEAVWIPGLAASDLAAGKLDPGVYWHGINAGIPNSGQPDKFAYPDPRAGISWDLFGTGKTLLRGGWGMYRYSDQYNDYTGALTTAQSILGYSIPGSTNIMLKQISSGAPQIVVPKLSGQTTCCVGGVNALNPRDNKVPLTTEWNMTISQQLKWNTLLEVAYIGSDSQNAVMGGEGISGSGFGDYTNQNKIPLGAFFKPDPVTR
jgi:hypothetical protein